MPHDIRAAERLRAADNPIRRQLMTRAKDRALLVIEGTRRLTQDILLSIENSADAVALAEEEKNFYARTWQETAHSLQTLAFAC